MIAESKLLLHCGAETVSRDAVMDHTPPPATETHFPVAHGTFLTSIEDALTQGGFNITAQEHSLSHEGARYFGLIQLGTQSPENDYNFVMGIRNSDDKAFSAGLAAGPRVFVCDNLAFNGEITIARKHTKNVLRDFRRLCASAIGRMGAQFEKTDERIRAYKDYELSDKRAAHFVMEACTRYKASTPTKIGQIWDEWKEPSHDEFAPRTAWSLFNAFTEVAKTLHPTTQAQRSEVLYGLTDSLVGVDLSN